MELTPQTRIESWLKMTRASVDDICEGSTLDGTIAASLQNGDIAMPEWMGSQDTSNGIRIWDTEESDGSYFYELA